MIPHLQVGSNAELALVLFCVLSMAAQVVATAFIMFMYYVRGVRIGTLAGKFPFMHVMYFAAAYGCGGGLLIASLSWDLYHSDISCWCFPLAVRVFWTIPVVIFGDLAIWHMFKRQRTAALNDPIRPR